MQRRHRARHRCIWLAMAVLVPAILAAALAVRFGQRADHPPERLAAP
jgi:hypothetical protein